MSGANQIAARQRHANHRETEPHNHHAPQMHAVRYYGASPWCLVSTIFLYFAT
jgi:hypothetical protein